MQFRFYKGDLNQEPLKTINQNWLGSRDDRNEKLKTVFDTIPFYDGWLGSESSIFGIVCIRDEAVLAELKETKGYKLESVNGKTVIKPDKRYKAGKQLDAKLTQCWRILQDSPDFSKFSLKRLLYRVINGIFFDSKHCKTAYESEISGKQHDERFEVLHKRQ